MLNESEQRRLDAIEEALLVDARLSACFLREWPTSPPRSLLPRCLVVSGSLIVAASVLLGLEGPLAQGLCLVVAGTAWSCRTRTTAGRCVRKVLGYWMR